MCLLSVSAGASNEASTTESPGGETISVASTTSTPEPTTASDATTTAPDATTTAPAAATTAPAAATTAPAAATTAPAAASTAPAAATAAPAAATTAPTAATTAPTAATTAPSAATTAPTAATTAPTAATTAPTAATTAPTAATTAPTAATTAPTAATTAPTAATTAPTAATTAPTAATTAPAASAAASTAPVEGCEIKKNQSDERSFQTNAIQECIVPSKIHTKITMKYCLALLVTLNGAIYCQGAGTKDIITRCQCGFLLGLGLLGPFPNTTDVEQGGTFVDTFGNPLLGLFGGLGKSLVLAGERINLGAAGTIPQWFVGLGEKLRGANNFQSAF
ncbi:integumentary mucin C.1-like [Condylostylus longicornis]|uniref:integumentary mucin C.1-like n=1 Tax=Condylostylus longicornis TaxID=2530218 RepID=UPI00244E4332|nr:integumentary mucin C.1-like [Condylostylus longicornis]